MGTLQKEHGGAFWKEPTVGYAKGGGWSKVGLEGGEAGERKKYGGWVRRGVQSKGKSVQVTHEEQGTVGGTGLW